MTHDTDTTALLDALFAEAKADPPTASDALLARIQADAEMSQPVPVPVGGVAEQGGWFTQIWQGVGGWPALGGLTTAACAGIWIGVSPPAPLLGVAENYLGLDTTPTLIDMSPDAAFDLSTEAF